ncbi:MAG TPA: hypothetical protein PLV85_25765, partial [Polyangiaceae bacterium]|nr:hypothetical protein [Polyangiaceae bacterium]
HLEELLARLGVVVRSESFDPHVFGDASARGGLCRLHDQTIVFVDARATLPDRIAVLAAAAARLDTDSVFMPPAVRQIIDGHRSRTVPWPQRPSLRLIHPHKRGVTTRKKRS